jgi:hypothetical protein
MRARGENRSIPNPDYTDLHADAPLFGNGGDSLHLSDGCDDISAIAPGRQSMRRRGH